MPRRNAILPIHFFKIILKTNLERLKIPNKFAEIFEGDLPNPIFIKPPDSTKWEVYWIKQNGEVWFKKGWKEFAQNYSLDYGNMVVFKYAGTFQLDVVILGNSAVEIDYTENLDQSDDDQPVSDQKRGQKSPLLSPRPHKKMRSEKPTQRTSSLNSPKEARAKEVAEKFISSNCNPFFTVSIKNVNLTKNYLCVPDLEGVIENKKKQVRLQIGKKSWNVNLLCRLGPTSTRRFCAGWYLFARENKLLPGDVCVFELLNKEDSVFKVHVYKCCS